MISGVEGYDGILLKYICTESLETFGADGISKLVSVEEEKRMTYPFSVLHDRCVVVVDTKVDVFLLAELKIKALLNIVPVNMDCFISIGATLFMVESNDMS